MSPATVLRLALRDLRGGLRSFAVFFACLALGVATIAAVGGVNNSVVETLRRDAKVLLGGDVVLEQPNLPIEPAVIEELAANASAISAIITTNAIAFAGERSVAISLKGVDDAYPLYGTIESAPQASAAESLADNGVLVDPALLARLGVAVGDRLKIGNGEVTIRGTLLFEPDQGGGFIDIGPRVLMARETVEGLGIIQPGSIVRYAWRAALPEGADATALVAGLQARYPDAGWQARSSASVQPRIARFTDRLASYLTLAGLAALLIGGLGVALAIQSWLAARTPAIATLRCIGARGRDILAIYGTQVAILTGAGVLIGLVAGALLPFGVRFVPAGILPVPIEYHLAVGPLLAAAACGIMTAFIFTWLPLARARDISPAGLFRQGAGGRQGRLARGDIAIVALGGIGLALAMVVSVDRTDLALGFVGGALVVGLLLAGLARLMIAGLARAARFGPPHLRLALTNLRRPGARSVSVVVAFGAGLAVLTMIGQLAQNLRAELSGTLASRAPSIVFVDLQPDQTESFRALIEATPGASIIQTAPMLRARIVRIGGLPVAEVDIAEGARWTTRRDRGLSFQAAMPEGTELVEGEWWPEDYDGPPLVSVEEDIARGYGVGVGDTLGFNILGRIIEAKIANLRREIDWSRGRVDFVFVLSPGVIDKAPHTTIASIDVPDEAAPALLDRVARALPNVTPISIGDMIGRVRDMLDRIGLAVAVVGSITLVSGLLVLAGAVAASRHDQIRQSVLLKVLGARRADVLRLFLFEFASIGLGAALLGMGIGLAATWVVVRTVFHLEWHLSVALMAGVPIAAMALAMAVGSIGIGAVLKVPAARILRAP